MSTSSSSTCRVKDLAKTIGFFTTLGFSFNEQFSDENTTCMVISDDS
jgi:predicted lactoylglutathione lyase